MIKNASIAVPGFRTVRARRAALLFALGAFVCAPSLANEVWRLIDADPPQLPTAPASSTAIGAKGIFTNAWSAAFTFVQDYSVKTRLTNELESVAMPALRSAALAGQRGVLIRTEYYYVEVQETKHYAFRPVFVVGMGQSADAVCFAEKCHLTITQSLPAGAIHPDDGWYTWIESNPSSKGYTLLRYSAELENSSSSKWLDAQYANAYQRLVYQQSLTGYAKALAENLNSKVERSAVGELIANRNKAMDRRDKVEVQLQDELRRAAKAANTAELLGGISQALQFTQVMTMASGMMGGEAISKSTTAPLKTSADVVRAVQGAGARAAAAAAELELERGQLINAIQGINGKILDAGVKNGIDQPGIFKVYLH